MESTLCAALLGITTPLPQLPVMAIPQLEARVWTYASRYGRAVDASSPLSPRSDAELVFPTTSNIAFIQPAGLGAPRASQTNPGGAGNAEGNWWTPSEVSPDDIEGKVAEIRRRQAISELNGRYKLEKLEADERKAKEAAAKQAREQEETRARQAKYANRR